MNEIEAYYDAIDEWGRFERHKVEFAVTKRYLDEYITGANLRILDIGGGPGRYSIYLAGKGHSVTLLDLSRKNVETAKEKAKEYGVCLNEIIHGDALRLSDFVGDRQYDAVLLMGPLYHLVREEDRRRAVGQALSHLNPGGLLIASFISAYGPVQDALAKMLPLTEGGDPLAYLNGPAGDPLHGFTTAYYIRPEEAQSLMADCGVPQLAFAGVENILGSREQELVRLPEEQFEKWLDIGYRLSRDASLFGASMHYLYIGQKPPEAFSLT